MTYDEVLDLCIGNWTFYIREAHAIEKYRGSSVGCSCSACGCKLEFVYRDPIDTFACPGCARKWHYSCPICREAMYDKVPLRYDREANTLNCPLHGIVYNVTPPGLNKTGTHLERRWGKS
jgi:hypothetical protein